jgi:protein-S-isoprenylcysteine O-methyltransferase Ste14
MLPAVLWLVYAVPAYLLWPLVFRARYGFSAVKERFPPRNFYGWIDFILGLALLGYSAWVVFRPHRGPPPISIPGGIGVWCAGAALRIWAVATLGRNWRIGQDDQDTQAEFVAAGPYKLMNHPINTALILVAIGQALLTGLSAGAIGLLTVAVAYFLIQGRAEERRWEKFKAHSSKFKSEPETRSEFEL